MYRSIETYNDMCTKLTLWCEETCSYSINFNGKRKKRRKLLVNLTLDSVLDLNQLLNETKTMSKNGNKFSKKKPFQQENSHFFFLYDFHVLI